MPTAMCNLCAAVGTLKAVQISSRYRRSETAAHINAEEFKLSIKPSPRCKALVKVPQRVGDNQVTIPFSMYHDEFTNLGQIGI